MGAIIVSQCVCGAVIYKNGTFNARDNNGVCNHNGGAGADGKGGHFYNPIEAGTFAEEVRRLAEEVKIIKKDESETKTNQEDKGQFHTPRTNQRNEIIRSKSNPNPNMSIENLDSSDTSESYASADSTNSKTRLTDNQVLGGMQYGKGRDKDKSKKKAKRVKSTTAADDEIRRNRKSTAIVYKCDSKPGWTWCKWPVYSCVLAIAAIVGVDNSLNEVFISCNDVLTKCIGIFGWFIGVFMILFGVWSDDEWNKLVSVFGFVSCLIGSIFLKLSGKGVTVDGIVKFGSSVNQRLGKKVCPFQVLFATCIGYTCIWFLLYFEHLCTTDDKGVCVSDKTRILFYIDICVLVLFFLFYPFLAYGLLGFKFFSMYSSGPDNFFDQLSKWIGVGCSKECVEGVYERCFTPPDVIQKRLDDIQTPPV